jgi:hypothetical protein
MDNYVSPDTVDAVRTLLDYPRATEVMADRNFALGRKFFSFELLEQRLRQVLMNFGQL